MSSRGDASDRFQNDYFCGAHCLALEWVMDFGTEESASSIEAKTRSLKRLTFQDIHPKNQVVNDTLK